MSALAPKTHNMPPIVPPTDQEMLDDLKGRFPELEKELADFEAALKTYPTDLTLKDAETAAALQDLLGKIKKHRSVIAAHKKTEKKPWSGLVAVVTNFFESADTKLEKLTDEWAPRHQAYMDLVKADNLRKANEEAERQRAIEEENRKRAEEAEQRRIAAEKAETEAREREEKARRDEEAAVKAREEAETRKVAAEAEERRLANEKRDRDRAEKEINTANIRDIKSNMKTAERLNDLAEAEKAEESDVQNMDMLVRAGGIIGNLAAIIFYSPLLDDEQKAYLTETRERLGVLRTTMNERVNKRERTRRAKETAAAEEKECLAAEERRLQREQDEARTTAAREAREKAEAETKVAKDAQEAAKGDIRDARSEVRGAQQEQKAAGKVERQAETDADRAANRADRIEYKLEKATDAEIAGTLRGELGTKGSLTRRWTLKIVDEEALREVCGPLGPTFTQDALNGAAYRWMLPRISGWAGRERVEGELPGVVFAYQQGARIST